MRNVSVKGKEASIESVHFNLLLSFFFFNCGSVDNDEEKEMQSHFFHSQEKLCLAQ